MTTRGQELAGQGPVEHHEERMKGRASEMAAAVADSGDEEIFKRLLKSCDARGWRRKRQRVHGVGDLRGRQQQANATNAVVGASDATPSAPGQQHLAAGVVGSSSSSGMYGAREAEYAERCAGIDCVEKF